MLTGKMAKSTPSVKDKDGNIIDSERNEAGKMGGAFQRTVLKPLSGLNK